MKVLVAEDDAVSRRVLQTMLAKWGYEVVAVRDGQEAWDALHADDAPKLAILDWMMPHLDGLQVCQKIRQEQTRQYIYILLLTARDQTEEVITGLDAGADDYMSKPFEAEELKARLRAGKRVLQLQEELLQANDALRFQATHDPLTTIWGRAAIFDILASELARAKRLETPVGIIMCDLDHFKKINDVYGHQAGDTVLRETAQRMLTAVRPYDAVGRYGGEEFLVVLSGCNQTDAMTVAGRLHTALISNSIELKDHTINVTSSFGVAVAIPPIELSFESLISVADEALLRAKSLGRNRIETAWSTTE